MRQERIDNKPPKGLDRTIFLAMKGLRFEEGSGGKKSSSQKRADAAQRREVEKEMGIQVKKRSPAKGGSGSSKGGHVSKKVKAAFEMSGQSIVDMEEGKGVSTNQATENQKPQPK